MSSVTEAGGERRGMCEIKFRAWDLDHHCFIYFSFADLQSMADFWGTHGLAENDMFHYQQYTGLKDKNRKEIYEGDICKGDGFFDELYPKEKQIGITEFRSGAFRVFNIDKQCRGGEVTLKYNLEIIENIYEHSDLITRHNNEQREEVKNI